jgi:hypothetical protein
VSGRRGEGRHRNRPPLSRHRRPIGHLVFSAAAAAGPIPSRRRRTGCRFPILEAVSLVVHLPEDLAARVEAAAAQRGVSAEDFVAEAVAAHLPAADDDPLEAFIGSGSSGRGDLARRHRQIRAELTGGHAAREL